MAGRGDGELFRSRDAQLYIGEGEDSMLMQSGDFALTLVKSAVSQLAAVVAMVGAVHWPVGRDCAVTRTAEARFLFSLPGPHSYTLILQSASSAAHLQSLQKLLEDYSTWTSLASAGSEAQGGSKSADDNLEPSRDAGLSKKRAGDDLSAEMVGRMQRARRMSAVAKVFSKSLERGTINVASHVKPMAMVNITQDSRSRLSTLSLAAVDAVVKVVEAVETGGSTLLESAVSVAATDQPSSVHGSSSAQFSDGSSGSIYSGWTLNNHGLRMLYRVIYSSMAIHGTESSRSGSSRSGSSSSSEFPRLLSSSSSSSSSSSKSPVTPAPHTDAKAADETSAAAAFPESASGTAALSSTTPPPPFFTPYAPRIRTSDMPPPSGTVPPRSPIPSESLGLSSFRIYKPRPTPATTPSAATPTPPPPFRPRPPRFQPPQL